MPNNRPQLVESVTKGSSANETGFVGSAHRDSVPFPAIDFARGENYRFRTPSTRDSATVSRTQPTRSSTSANYGEKNNNQSSSFTTRRSDMEELSSSTGVHGKGKQRVEMVLRANEKCHAVLPINKTSSAADPFRRSSPETGTAPPASWSFVDSLPSQIGDKKERHSLLRFPSETSVPETSATSLEAVVAQRTIAEQQRTIYSLQELLQSTKAAVEYLEEQNKALRQKQQEASPMLVEELNMLRTNNVKLIQQTALLLDEKSLVEKRLEGSHIALKDMDCRLQEQLKITRDRITREEDYQYQVSLLHIAENERDQLKAENAELRRALDRCAFEKKRWRALVHTLAAHLPLSLNGHIEKHVRSMVEEEEQRFKEAVLERKAKQEPLLTEYSSHQSMINSDGYAEGYNSQGYHETGCGDHTIMPSYASGNPSEEIQMIWRKPMAVCESYQTNADGRGESEVYKTAGNAGHATASANLALVGTTLNSAQLSQPAASKPRGALTSVPFHHSPSIPPRLPGSVALGVYAEDAPLPSSHRLHTCGKRKPNTLSHS